MSNYRPEPLFESQNLRLTPVDLEKDPQVIAAWTVELNTAAQMREDQPARPMAAFEVKKIYDRWQKAAEENDRQFLFAIRRRDKQSDDADPIIGVLRIKHVEWVHGAAYLDLILGSTQDWQEFAREVLDLGLRYAFDELGLFRVTAVIGEHNEDAHQLFEQANFTLEVRQRQSVYWNARSWDKLFFGLLRPEWKMMQLAEMNA
jgi:RimJ/RimL family protein N-acetyltransferase